MMTTQTRIKEDVQKNSTKKTIQELKEEKQRKCTKSSEKIRVMKRSYDGAEAKLDKES